MCRKVGLISLIALINLIGWISLAISEEEIRRDYELKVKLKPKVIESKVYWQGKGNIDWKEEIKNWKFGLLADEVIPPIIVYKENFYPEEEDFLGRFRWISNNAEILLLNPVNAKLKANLYFAADSFKKDKRLKISLNGKEIKTILVPVKNEFSQFVIEGIILNPGENQLLFFVPEGTERLKPEARGKDKQPKKVSIKVKDDLRFENISKVDALKETPPEYAVTISDETLELLVHFKKGKYFLFMFTDLDIDLEEYPYFDFGFPLKGSESEDLEAFLGIDWTGDGVIDGYLKPENLEEINLFELAKETYPDIDYFKHGFRLKKIILRLTPKERLIKGKTCVYQFKEFNIYYSRNSISLPIWEKKGTELTIHEVSNLDYTPFFSKDLIISSYFDARTIGTELEKIKEEVKFILKDGKELTGEIESESGNEFKLRSVEELEGGNIIIKKDAINYYYYLPKPIERKKVLEDEFVDLGLTFEQKGKVSERVDFIIIYKLDEPEIQELELFFDIDKNEDGVVDERIIAGKKELIKGFKFIGPSGNIDLYEAYLSEDFPDFYKSTGETKSRFIVYKDDRPLELTWMKWFGDKELVEAGVVSRKVLISLPQRTIPQAEYSIIYLPVSEASGIYEGYQELKIPIEPDLINQIKRIVIRMKRKKDKEIDGWFNFYIKEIGFYKDFAYPVKERETEVLNLLVQSEIPLLKIDEQIFRLKDLEIPKRFEDLERDVLSKKIELARGKHDYEKLENYTFDIEWVILEPVRSPQSSVHSEKEPQLTFKKINPTKYLVKVEDAKEPFWLVFSESFHKQWRLYQMPETSSQKSEFDEIIADYPKLGVKEVRHLMKFTPKDIKYLFRKPLNAKHQLVNGYANGWYIEPKKLGLGENFTLVIYFWSQSLLYLGLGISGLTLIGCIGYLIGSYFKKESAKG